MPNVKKTLKSDQTNGVQSWLCRFGTVRFGVYHSAMGQKPFRHLFGKSSLTFYLFSAWLKEWYITGREINQNARAIIALLCFLSLIFYSCNTLRFCKTQDCCGCLWHSLPFFHWTVVDTNIIHGLWLAFKSLSGVHSVGWGALTLMFYPSSFT